MFSGPTRRIQSFLNLLDISTRKSYKKNLTAATGCRWSLVAFYCKESECPVVPISRRKYEKKPWVTDINDVKWEARVKRKERRIVRESGLESPHNGLLVQNLVPVAHEVLADRTQLFRCASKVSKIIPVHFCSVCGEVHVGDPPHLIRTCNVSGSQKNKEHIWKRGGVEHVLPDVETFHLYDRMGRAVSHNERLLVDRIPAIIELCIQAGVDIPKYPTRRREFPVYCIAGKMIDFEKRNPQSDLSEKDLSTNYFGERSLRSEEDNNFLDFPCDDLRGFADQGMKAFDELCYGVVQLMEKYDVQTCGYCNEVQVGPRGHRVRHCQAFKHQMRDGQHAWQKASVDDIIPPVYVWHVGNLQDTLLIDALKRYYGKLPAVIELFAQAGAVVGEKFQGMMKGDVVVPEVHEEKLVV